MIGAKAIKALFYQTARANMPAREEILKLDREDRKKVGEDIKAVEIGWPLGMPLCRKVTSEIWEVRSDISTGIFRVLFALDGPDMVLLHAFVKKTQKTPNADLDLAVRRWQRYKAA